MCNLVYSRTLLKYKKVFVANGLNPLTYLEKNLKHFDNSDYHNCLKPL